MWGSTAVANTRWVLYRAHAGQQRGWGRTRTAILRAGGTLEYRHCPPRAYSSPTSPQPHATQPLTKPPPTPPLPSSLPCSPRRSASFLLPGSLLRARMFYSHQLLARKAPLGQIWCASPPLLSPFSVRPRCACGGHRFRLFSRVYFRVFRWNVRWFRVFSGVSARSAPNAGSARPPAAAASTRPLLTLSCSFVLAGWRRRSTPRSTAGASTNSTSSKSGEPTISPNPSLAISLAVFPCPP